mgnify:CR=1 FL=1
MAIIKNWSKKDIIIVDNLAQSFANDHENGIPIRPFINDKEDHELHYLAQILKELRSDECSLEFLERQFNLKHLLTLN